MAEIISLIADSGIQFYTTEINIPQDSEAYSSVMKFVEIKVGNQYDFEFPYFYSTGEYNIVKDDYVMQAYDSVKKKIDESKLNPNFLRQINTENGDDFLYSIQARDAFAIYEEKWLPIPLFRKINQDGGVDKGPTTWARMRLSKISARDANYGKYTHLLTLAIDTKTKLGQKEYAVPEKDKDMNAVFICSNNEVVNYNFVSLPWVLEWLNDEYNDYKYLLKSNPKAGNLSSRVDKYSFYALGLYLTFLQTLSNLEVFPAFSIHTSESNIYDKEQSIEVDLVLDIGNSRTCGLLFETTGGNKGFSLKNAKPLEIRDLTYPSKYYSEPFSMRLAFIKASFGRNVLIESNIDAFKWPSLLRIGPEANRSLVLNNNLASNFTLSSPKRYLWDDEKAIYPWEFLSEINERAKQIQATPVYLTGVSEQFSSNGEFIAKINSMPALTPFYARRSLMTFVYMELFLHAISQINSYRFRKDMGQEFIPRKLKRITITCPTAMTKKEQAFLRESALDALNALTNFFGETFLDPKAFKNDESEIKIVPSPTELKLSESSDNLELKKDWGYDEATANQITFIYGEIMHRYSGRSKDYFDTYGKLRDGLKLKDEKSLIIASIDIGGGTTDLMICAYQTDPKSESAVIIPQPLFWDGFNIAGDDILRKLIERIVLPQFAEYAKTKGISGNKLVQAMHFLFGNFMKDANDILMRKHFTTQIALPIAYGIIKHAVEETSSGRLDFNSVFIDFPMPQLPLLTYINNKFKEFGAGDFDIKQIVWMFSSEGINTVVKDTIEKLLGEISIIISQYDCDMVLLSGKPSTIPVIRDIFLKYLPVFPDRIVSLGNYRIGQWYPYADATGRIKDPKTSVAVGATIALMGGKLMRLDGFRLEIQDLKTKFKSTADYIGAFDKQYFKVPKTFFSPLNPRAEILFDNDLLLGFRQLNMPEWTASVIYKLGFSNNDAREKYSGRLPFKVEIERDFNESKEDLSKIQSILDKNGDDIPISALKLRLQTMADDSGYWLDTGIYELPLNY